MKSTDMANRILLGYTLMLACTACGLKKRIAHFPECAAFPLHAILDSQHIEIYKTGCLRCGVCRFSVESVPPPPPPPAGPVGWSEKLNT